MYVVMWLIQIKLVLSGHSATFKYYEEAISFVHMLEEDPRIFNIELLAQD